MWEPTDMQVNEFLDEEKGAWKLWDKEEKRRYEKKVRTERRWQGMEG